MLVCMSISFPLLGFDNCMFEASRCCAGGFAKGGRGSTVLNCSTKIVTLVVKKFFLLMCMWVWMLGIIFIIVMNF